MRADKSPPVRGRGLKPGLTWTAEAERRSPPVRGRGLKQRGGRDGATVLVSPPVRGRGLKRRNPETRDHCARVAPRAGAWIETRPARCRGRGTGGRPPCGGVD